MRSAAQLLMKSDTLAKHAKGTIMATSSFANISASLQVPPGHSYLE
jgi:hypothetical protein